LTLQLPQRTAQAVEFPDHQHITGVQALMKLDG